MAETSHVFCCVLPVVFSVLSLMSGVGLISTMPTGLVWFHDVMHDYEVPMIIVSGVILLLGWALSWYAERIDCHDTPHGGCHHEPCAPKKKRAHKVLIVASVLFTLNVLVYFGFHRGVDLPDAHAGHASHAEDGHHH